MRHSNGFAIAMCLIALVLTLALPRGSNSQTPCIPGTNSCDDGDPCTTDTCSEVSPFICVYTPITCDDGDICTNDSCSDGVCIFEDASSNDPSCASLLLVTIDVKPGSDPNCFNIDGHGVVPVAILGSDTLDVNNINIASLLFDGLDVRVRGNRGPLCAVEDVNGDAYPDLVCHFEDDPNNWTAGDSIATLTGMLNDGTAIEGIDDICVVP
jgi:hypothetical protein